MTQCCSAARPAPSHCSERLVAGYVLQCICALVQRPSRLCREGETLAGGFDVVADHQKRSRSAAMQQAIDAHGHSIARVFLEPSHGAPHCVMLWCVPDRQGEAMAQARYFVVQHGDVWMIKSDDEEFGPYKSKNEAMLSGV